MCRASSASQQISLKLLKAASSEREPALATTQAEIARLWNRDYGHALRGGLSRAEVREIVGAAKRKAWPNLNDSAVRLGSMKEFAARASALGADFKIAKMPWPSGLALLGFYLGKDSGLEKRPLICLNGAHHPAAVATAFLHEVGHHVTADLFSTRNELVQLSRQTGYDSHLNNARELAADVLVSLGIYPRNMAAKLFEVDRDRRIPRERRRKITPDGKGGRSAPRAVTVSISSACPIRKSSSTRPASSISPACARLSSRNTASRFRFPKIGMRPPSRH